VGLCKRCADGEGDDYIVGVLGGAVRVSEYGGDDDDDAEEDLLRNAGAKRLTWCPERSCSE